MQPEFDRQQCDHPVSAKTLVRPALASNVPATCFVASPVRLRFEVPATSPSRTWIGKHTNEFKGGKNAVDLAWAAILGALYWFVPSFRRMVNGWIVQLGDKVKHDADVPYTPEPVTDKEVEDLGGRDVPYGFPEQPRHR